MFNMGQIKSIFERYAEDVVIHRGEKEIPQRGLLLLGGEKEQRFDFGVVEQQSGTFIYGCYSEDLIDGDILNFCGEEYLLSNPKDIMFKNQVVYKKAKLEKIQ